MSFVRRVFLGAVAGAAGTAALNIATYGDMVLRGRGESGVPSQMVKNAAEAAGIGALASDDETKGHRRDGIGALLRPAMRRVPVVLAGLAAGGAAMALSDIPIAKSGASDPRTWGAAGWAADAIPHVCYGLALAFSFDAVHD
jgi:hypothetical protein